VRAVFLDVATVDRGDLDLSPLTGVWPEWDFHDNSTAAEVTARLTGASIAVSNKAFVGAREIDPARDLKMVCVAATGTNNVDLDALRARGIAVSNVVGYATPSVAQHVVLLMTALLGNFENYRRLVNRGEWQTSPTFSPINFPIAELEGKTLGVVGYGTLGRRVAQLGEAFGMNVLIAARTGQPAVAPRVPLEELLTRVDVLSLHCPLTEHTRNLIGARELALMRPGAVLINTARGGIVDEDALAQALRSGHLGGAGVDVLTVEPPVRFNPLLDPALPNLIVTPHIAWASREARQRLISEVARNIAAHLRGERRNRVD
jgi:glycerate dehydrogenase